MDVILLVTEIVIFLILGFLFRYIKLLPDKIHEQQKLKFNFELNKQLEEFKSKLAKEMEVLRINESQLHIHKTEEFIELIEFVFTKTLDKKYIAKLSTDKRTILEFNQKMLSLGAKLFLFASDKTVKKYVEWREFGLNDKNKNDNNHQILLIMAELMVLIRKDLGYAETECNRDDFLNIMLTDWNLHKENYTN